MFPSPDGVPMERCGISWVENMTARAQPSMSSSVIPLLSIWVKVCQSSTGRGSAGVKLCVKR